MDNTRSSKAKWCQCVQTHAQAHTHTHMHTCITATDCVVQCFKAASSACLMNAKTFMGDMHNTANGPAETPGVQTCGSHLMPLASMYFLALQDHMRISRRSVVLLP